MTSPDNVSSSSKGSSPAGAIVGGVLGGIVLCVAILGGVWYYLRRRSRGQPYLYRLTDVSGLLDDETKPNIDNTPTPPSPPNTTTRSSSQRSRFKYAPTIDDPQSNSSPQSGPRDDSSRSAFTYQGVSHRTSSAVLSVANPTHDNLIASSIQLHSKAVEAGLLSMPPETTYHADSGIRFESSVEASTSDDLGQASELVDVPPTYTEK
ncbi:unnamed protein product [Somion occarium]|uniref:Uncharacterized protein n=1 Tax=Somion occarium TaxID=3059160 RepID=A0ABP1DD43_9APHY